MRIGVALIGGVVLVALLIIDPVALGRLGYSCAIGGCGVRPIWLGAGFAVIVLLVALRRHFGGSPAAPAIPVRKLRQSAKPRIKARATPRKRTRSRA